MAVPKRLQTSIIPPRRKQTIVDLGETIKRATEIGLQVSFPATVLSFNSDQQLVNISPDFLIVRYTDQTEMVEEPIELVNVPIQFPGNSAESYLTFPVEAGQKGLAHVTDRSLDDWLEDGEQLAPPFNHLHRNIDCIFVPNLRDKSRAIPSFDNVSAVLESTLIKIGASAVEAAAFGTALQAWANSITTIFDAHIHPAPGGATAVTATPFPIVPTLASTKVKIE